MDRDSVIGYKPLLYGIYAIYALAGVGFVTDPSPRMTSMLEPLQYNLWAGFLLVGGVLGALGSILSKHYVEGVALIALIGGLVVYTVALMFTTGPPGSLGLPLLIVSSIGTLAARGVIVRHQIQIRARLSEAIRHESD